MVGGVVWRLGKGYEAASWNRRWGSTGFGSLANEEKEIGAPPKFENSRRFDFDRAAYTNI